MIGSTACMMETELNFLSDANPFNVVGVTLDLLLTLVMGSSFHLSTLFVSAPFDLSKAVPRKLLIPVFMLDFLMIIISFCCNFYIKNWVLLRCKY